MKIKKVNEMNESTQQKIAFKKQTMKMSIDWVAKKDFDVHYKYRWTKHRIEDHENGTNFPNGINGELADTSVLQFMNKTQFGYMKDYAKIHGGSPKAAFTVKKDTKIKVEVGKYDTLYIEILDGEHAGEKFTAELVDFRTCLIGTPKDKNLVISKYRIFLNGKPLKPKYYTDMGRIKSALRVAFKFTKAYDDEDVPEYIGAYEENTIDKSDLKNVQIMRYDNDSKIPVPVDFNVEDYYKELMMKKNAKNFNI